MEFDIVGEYSKRIFYAGSICSPQAISQQKIERALLRRKTKSVRKPDGKLIVKGVQSQYFCRQKGFPVLDISGRKGLNTRPEL